MTLASTPPTISYSENGSTLAFAVPFQFLAAADLVVTRTGPDGTATTAVLGADYNVSGGAGATGTVTMAVAKAAGWTLTIVRRTAQTQPMDYTPGDTFPAESHERALDRVTMIAQEVDAHVVDLGGRAIRVPPGETAAQLPPAAGRLSKIFGFDAAGAWFLYSLQTLANALMTYILPLLPGNLKGDPGGTELATGAFTALSGQSIRLGVNVIRTEEYGAGTGKGAAFLRYAPQGSFAADQAFVAAHPGWAKLSANSRLFILDRDQPRIYFEMFGAIGDATLGNTGTDDYAAWLAAKDFIHFYRVYPAGNTYYKPSVPLWFRPAGYRFSHYLDLTDAAYELFGSGNGAASGHGGTTFWMDAGQPGLVLQSWDTRNISDINQSNTASDPHGASGSHIADIVLLPRGGTIASQNEHGIILKCGGCWFERVVARHFGGDGLHLYGNVPGSGNANSNRFDFCGFHNNGLSGSYTAGGDGNANSFNHCHENFNRKFGIAEGAFLINWYKNFHIAGNGMNKSYGAGPYWASSTDVPGARCTYGGHVYSVLPGMDIAAQTTQPGTDPTVWRDEGAGAPGFVEAWVSGHKYCSGGALYCGSGTYVQNNNNASEFDGYTESDQPIGFCQSTSCKGFGQEFKAINGALVSPRIGSRGIRTDGHVLGREHGGDPNAGTIGSVRYDDNEIWTETVNVANADISWSRFGSVVIVRKGDATLAGIDLPRGLSISGGLTSAASDAAAATAGVQVNRIYFNTTIGALRPRMS